MNDKDLIEFLDWITNETTFNIPKDEINEIVQDWNRFKANSSDKNNKPFVKENVSVNAVAVCPHCSADSSKMVEAAKYKCFGCGRFFYGHTER